MIQRLRVGVKFASLDTIAKTGVCRGGLPNTRSSSITLSLEGPNHMLLANMIFEFGTSPNQGLSEIIQRSAMGNEGHGEGLEWQANIDNSGRVQSLTII